MINSNGKFNNNRISKLKINTNTNIQEVLKPYYKKKENFDDNIDYKVIDLYKNNEYLKSSPKSKSQKNMEKQILINNSNNINFNNLNTNYNLNIINTNSINNNRNSETINSDIKSDVHSKKKLDTISSTGDIFKLSTIKQICRKDVLEITGKVPLKISAAFGRTAYAFCLGKEYKKRSIHNKINSNNINNNKNKGNDNINQNLNNEDTKNKNIKKYYLDINS